jgi:hypothetical protein
VIVPITHERAAFYTKTNVHSATTGFVTATWTLAFYTRVDVQENREGVTTEEYGNPPVHSKVAFAFKNVRIIEGMKMVRENGEAYIVYSPIHYESHTEMVLRADPVTL